jgi:eukaryotic-like serine/threonine-protein kinase
MGAPARAIEMNLTELASLFPDCSALQTIAVRTGQKEVVRALRNQRAVAIKLFYKVAGDQERIDREIAAVAKLQCSFVPEVFRSGQVTLDGVERVFLIEEFIEGETYRTVLERTPVQPLASVFDLAKILLQVSVDCETAGLVHRDYKPENLVLDANGKTWVLDFGIVRHIDLSTVTPTGQGVGTWGYAPIEQMRLFKATIDIRADLFAIGTILYEGLNGRNPWTDGTQDVHDVSRKMVTQELPRLAINGDVNGEFSNFLSWLTQRFPSRRPQSAAEALAAFELIYQTLKPVDP